MNHLRTIDPLKSLKGKLNFLKFENQPILEILKLVNSISSHPANKQKTSTSSLQNLSLEDINNLRNPNNLTKQQYNKMIFQSHVHRNADPQAPIGTVHEQLDKNQKRLVLSLLKFSDRLNARQMAYLQYSVRQKLNSIYPNWGNLHFNPDSPFRKQFTLIPNLSSIQHLNEIKLVPKKQVTTAIISARKKVQQTPKE